METLKGLLYINETDAYDYGAFLAEEKEGNHKNYDSLMKPAKAKAYTSVSFREENGEKYPDKLISTSEGRDIDLRFAILGANKMDFLQKYVGFIQLLKNGNKGWLNLRFTELDMNFRVFYKESNGYDQLTYFDDGEVGAIVKVRFREPEPTF